MSSGIFYFSFREVAHSEVKVCTDAVQTWGEREGMLIGIQGGWQKGVCNLMLSFRDPGRQPRLPITVNPEA